MDLKDAIISIAAAVGMLLGIYNFFHARAADRVRLKVIAKASSFRGRDDTGKLFYLHNRDRFDPDHPAGCPDSLSLEVINLSKFSVTVDEVGLRARWDRNRLVLVNPIVPDEKPWPRKLDPRESVTIHFNLTNLIESPRFPTVVRAYATTACGTTCFGTSGALRDLVRHVKNAA